MKAWRGRVYWRHDEDSPEYVRDGDFGDFEDCRSQVDSRRGGYVALMSEDGTLLHSHPHLRERAGRNVVGGPGRPRVKAKRGRR